MPLVVAQEAISEAFSSDFEEVEIDFHGGEPFLCFREIKQICEWLWQEKWPKPYICFATTNGTLIHKSIRQWVVENHKRFICGLSLDGTRRMHNINRSDSFDQIDIELFLELWPFQPVKMTVSPSSIETLAEGVIFLHKKGFVVECSLASGAIWEKNSFDVFASELEKLVEFYISNPEIVPCRLVNMGLEYALNKGDEDIKWCGTGTNMVSVGMDGAKYPCHMFMPSTSPSYAESNIYSQAIFDFLASSDSILVDDGCRQCVLLGVCPTCYGSNWRETGSVIRRSINDCRFTKIRAKANAYLIARTMEYRERYKFLSNKEDSGIHRMIDNIETINRTILI